LPLRIPADQVLHVYKPVRIGAVRGEPWFSRALVRLYDYDQYTDAELMRKKVAAMFAAFITEPDPEYPVLPSSGDLGDQNLTIPRMQPPGVSLATLEPGTVQNLRPGEDVRFSTPADVGPNFESFGRSALREIAAAAGLTYEQLSNDLSGVNYSSIRAGLLAFRRKVEALQHQMIVFSFCDPIWRYWVNTAMTAGIIKARDFRKNTPDYYRVKWIAPGWTWVDPEKEVNADKIAVRAGFKSLPQVISERGYDIEEIIAETKAAYDLADKAGIIFDTDVRQTSATGMRQTDSPVEDPSGQLATQSKPTPTNNE
jgi:lambda family phage portal protein